jgi:hypothetical protein
VSLISKRVIWIRGSTIGVFFPLIQVGERHIQGLVEKCHDSRDKFVYFKEILA